MERFRHPWLSPMALGPETQQWLAARTTTNQVFDDRFKLGDYGLGLFHHDVSEAAIALVHEPEMLEACFGSLLCFLDCAGADGCIHRIELPHEARDREPAKPVMAQLALRVLEALGEAGLERFETHDVASRLGRFVDFLETTHTGAHGLLLSPSSRASGFDSDLSTAGFPEKSIETPDQNALMVLEYRALAELRRRIGDAREADILDEKAELLRERMEQLLYYEDEDGGFYVALRSHGGRVEHRDADGIVRPIQTWTGLVPLYAGIPSPARAARVIGRVLEPSGYWGPHGVRTVPASSPFFHQAPRVMVYDPRRGEPGPVSNWNGPVWILSNYYLARGLERYGELDRARELDDRTLELLASDLQASATLHECYDDAGRGLWPTRGCFVSWNALALILRKREVRDPVLLQSGAR